uniref:Nitric oxide synthase n=1 Tax=Hadrurus spadix TaxID=141984 RepID=A0A1W7RA54_9SCOR
MTSPSSKHPRRLRNIATNHITVDSLYQNCDERVQCGNCVCAGSLMPVPQKHQYGTSRCKEEVIAQAKSFFNQYYASIKRYDSLAHRERLDEVIREVSERGTYELKETELIYGAKLAWRNSPRCIGRIQWSKLQVFDARYVTTAEEMFEALCKHIRYATNKGNIRSAITVFPQRTDGKHDFRVWNSQLLQYAGYRLPDGGVIGDPINVEFTEVCERLGWKGKRGKWDVLPLVLSANGHDPKFFDIPDDLILRVEIVHPEYKWFKDLDLQWYVLPAVANMLFDVGGVEFPGSPFNGWYMGTEIGTRDLCDAHRYNILEDVALRMGLDTRSASTLWKDKAVVEINIAVLYSFQLANVTIVDHHNASESYMKHCDNEQRLRGGCPADWLWIVPPISGSITPVFHQEMLFYQLKPSYEYQEPAWQTHVWEKDQERNNSVAKVPIRKFKFKEIAKAVKFTSNLFGKALSRRIKATILYATETGRSEEYAKILGNIFFHAFNVEVICMSDYDIINLEHETLLLIVTSTFGNGDPPENGEAFARNLQAIKVTGDATPDLTFVRSTSMSFVRINSVSLDTDDSEPYSPSQNVDIGPLSNVRFAVFALGSSAYPNFCSFGKCLDSLLSDLGGEKILKIATGDELCGQEQSFRKWAQDVFKVACDVFCIGDDVNMNDATASLVSNTAWTPDKVRLRPVKSVEVNLLKDFSKKTGKKLSCTQVERKISLHAEEENRNTIQVQLKINQADLQFLPGDHVGIYPENREDLVNGILKFMQETCPNPDDIVQVEYLKPVQTLDGIQEKWTKHERLQPCSVRTALSRYLDITTPPSQQLLSVLALMAKDDEDKKKLEVLSKDANKYENWKSYYYPHFLEVLQEFPSLVLIPSFLLTQLPPVQPRFYSISSSLDANPGQIHITVAVVRFFTQEGRGPLHYGVCSNYLANIPESNEVVCFVRSAPNFRLPDSHHLPVIMVGPGTGIAPFRSFWQQRHSDMSKATSSEKKEFGKMLLFFGCRRPSVQLYQEETQLMKENNVLTDVYTAYSRMQNEPKRYVQDIMREMAPTVYSIITKEKGHFYVCGDVSMAEDVRRTLKNIIEEISGLPQQAAESLIVTLQDENRYHEDIFGITLRTAEVTSRGRAEAMTKRTV